jgi:BirA family biotin operon repressor/biotin-[acetyl-CoA-carboxylase] ligase
MISGLDSSPAAMATPYSLHIFEEVTSTQDVATGLFSGRPVLVVAARQSQGRGRGGDLWISAPRGMAASLALTTHWPPARRPLIPLVAGLAAAAVTDPVCRLKWPNDLLLGDVKIGGLLVEAAGDRVVAGFGLNLSWPKPPPGIGALHTADPGSEEGLRLAEGWAIDLLARLERGEWDREEYRRRSATLGREVTWEPEGRGLAVDIDDDGALLVATATGTMRLTAGQIRHLRDA